MRVPIPFHSRLITIPLVSGLQLMVACSVPESRGPRGFVDLVPAGQVANRTDQPEGFGRVIMEARSVEGRPLRARLIGKKGPCLLLLGAIHGDEPGSADLVRDFVEWLRVHPIEIRGIRIVVVSPVNPDGLERGSRTNARSIDLNRNFPAKNFRASSQRGQQPLSEPESRFLARLLDSYKPQLVITVHQPRRSVNWDGPAESLARAMARLNGYRPEASVGYPTPGSLGSWVGIDQQIPILTLELPRKPSTKGSFLAENLSALILAMASLRTGPEFRSCGCCGGCEYAKRTDRSHHFQGCDHALELLCQIGEDYLCTDQCQITRPVAHVIPDDADSGS